MDFTTMSTEERAEAIAKMDNAALTAALTATREKAAALFALDAPTIAQADEAEALVASMGVIEGEQATRAAAVSDAEARFAAAKAVFSKDDEKEDGEDEAEGEKEKPFSEDGGDSINDGVETSESDESDEADEADEPEEEATVTASGNQTINGKTSAARKVAAKVKRPAKAEASPVTITAAADVPTFATGAEMAGMGDVAKAFISRAKGFAPFNERAAQAVRSQGGGITEQLNKVGLASFSTNFDPSLTAGGGVDQQYSTVKNALKQHQDALSASLLAGASGKDATLAAAGWCAPSEQTYSFLTDYKMDGMLTLPEVSAPRGGLLITTGPALSDVYADLDTFGFVQTEAQAEAGTVKTCETIVCPDFLDYRLDAVGYCWKIPLLTAKAFPELIADALKLSTVLYAHKLNERFIADIVAASSVETMAGLGATFTDTLEALTIVALKERRRWNIGDSAVMEVKMPLFAREVFRADMSRRSGRNLNDVATDQMISAEFATRGLAVEYVNDWQQLTGTAAVFPASFDVLIYPAGTFVKAVEDVINIQAVYDAASLSVNEYTGVFFEQGILTAKVGYGSRKVTIPICTAGLTGASVLDCDPLTTNKAGA